MTTSTKGKVTTSNDDAVDSNVSPFPRTKSAVALPLASELCVGREEVEGGRSEESHEPATSPVKSIYSGNGHGPVGEASEAHKRLSSLSSLTKKSSFSNIRHGFSALAPFSSAVSPSASNSSQTSARVTTSPQPGAVETISPAQVEPAPDATAPVPPAVLPPPVAPAPPPPIQQLLPAVEFNLGPPAFAAPQSPRTTRRQMLAAELPEELRKQLLWERMSRQKILGAGAARTNGGSESTAGGISRSASTPKLAGEKGDRPDMGTRSSTDSGEVTPRPHPSSNPSSPPGPPPAAKRSSTVLGGNALRPLTTVSTSSSPTPPSGANLQRSKSTSSRLPPRRTKRANSSCNGERIRPIDPRTGEEMDSSDEEREAERAKERREEEEDGGARLKRRNTHHGNLSMMYADEGWDADYHSRGF